MIILFFFLNFLVKLSRRITKAGTCLLLPKNDITSDVDPDPVGSAFIWSVDSDPFSECGTDLEV